MTVKDVYWRRCRLIRVVDGDTCDAEIDAGFHLTILQRLRLLGVDTPELHASDPAVRAAAVAAAALTAKWFIDHAHPDAPPLWPFNLRTEKADAFGRYLAVVVCSQDHSLTDDLLVAGHVPWKRGN